MFFISLLFYKLCSERKKTLHGGRAAFKIRLLLTQKNSLHITYRLGNSYQSKNKSNMNM